MTSSRSIFRFAPSPNGRLHLGHAYSALLNAELAARTGGELLVRIEDIDVTRCTKELTEACLQDLAWLGLSWKQPVRMQSQHWDDYAASLRRLQSRGLVYPCFCTRSEVAAAAVSNDPDGAPIYAGRCKHLPAHEAAKRIEEWQPHCWRLDMKKALADAASTHLTYMRFSPYAMEEELVDAKPQLWGDAILARKEISTSYHLSVVVDDAIQGVTHVVRGQDLEAATCLHRLLQTLLGLPSPKYHHHALLKNEAGDKLSKSKGHEAIKDLRERGISVAEIRRMVGIV